MSPAHRTGATAGKEKEDMERSRGKRAVQEGRRRGALKQPGILFSALGKGLTSRELAFRIETHARTR